jgi:hypothetical protein
MGLQRALEAWAHVGRTLLSAPFDLDLLDSSLPRAWPPK